VRPSLKVLYSTQQQNATYYIQTSVRWDACGRGFLDSIVPLSMPVLVVASQRLSFSVLPAIGFLFLDSTCFIVENVLSHTYVLPNIECIFSAKSFSLRNLSVLTNF